MASTTVASPPAKARSSSTPSVSYEKFAPRSSSQVSRLSRIAALTAGPTARAATAATEIPDNADFLLQAMSPPPGKGQEEKEDESVVVVHQTLETTADTVDHLVQLLKHTTSMRLALRASINIADDISNRHAELLRHSGELSAAADRLQEEEAMLTRHAEEIGLPLKHYDAVDRIGLAVGVLFKGTTTVRGLAKAKVDNDDFPELLDEIDEAVSFFGRECGGKAALEQAEKEAAKTKSQQLVSGSIEYFRRALALQEAALDLIKEAVVERISNTSTQVADALNIPKVPIPADKLEASLVYTRYHGISSRSNRLLTLVRRRLNQGDAYYELLHLCRTTYCNSRENLLKTTVSTHMDSLKNQHGLVGMTRLASVFLIRLCTVETSLYLDFFGDKKLEEKKGEEEKATTAAGKKKSMASQVLSNDGTYYDSEFQNYLTNLCSSLHRTIRRGLVTMLDLDTLCQIVSVLREERSMASSSPTTVAAARAISSVIEDAQERLIFCANSALSKEVIRFKATPSDLDYPDRLKKKETPEDDSKLPEEERMEKQLLAVYESWFPPMRSVLKILSKIFRVVEPHVFEDIALQSVQACTKCLRDGAVYINGRKGQMHSDLFLVKHLLVLREQLSPFDIELRSVERQLDFSDAGRAVARFLANRNRRLFSMTTENALITLLREGVSVQESSVDSKRDLEDALRSACNDFIEHTCKSVAGDLMTFVETNKGSMNPAALQDVVAKTDAALDDSFGEVLTQMGLYLDNPATQNILLKPVSRKVVKAIDEAKKEVNGASEGWDEETKSGILTALGSLEQKVKAFAKGSAPNK
ncbi:Golgi complex subunit 3 [Seminavis robusta]|uniref:Golgi complex subunit 3 n=1 Tax=Seminavis robusta TaxID=568900 RepID=A0A9N8DTS4_9STRA|nr:Golgi complex subunit 3 [Seminavis robusta]|eukprot:Sro346_g122610.1 Golgi complex subunit 3 (816) ;mRNA; r:9401-11934